MVPASPSGTGTGRLHSVTDLGGDGDAAGQLKYPPGVPPQSLFKYIKRKNGLGPKAKPKPCRRVDKPVPVPVVGVAVGVPVSSTALASPRPCEMRRDRCAASGDSQPCQNRNRRNNKNEDRICGDECCELGCYTCYICYYCGPQCVALCSEAAECCCCVMTNVASGVGECCETCGNCCEGCDGCC